MFDWYWNRRCEFATYGAKEATAIDIMAISSKNPAAMMR